MTATATSERLTAPERREQILEAAVTVFAERGYEGASTDVIARMAGISQPYLFRLFGTKRELIIATIRDASPTPRSSSPARRRVSPARTP